MLKRISAAMLAALMLIPAMAACSEDAGTPAGDTTASADTTTTAPIETEPAETERKDAKDNLPADLNLGGKTLGVYMRKSFRVRDWDGGGEETGDLVSDLVYRRTETVKERLNVQFETTAMSGSWKDFGKEMEKNIMAGDDTWQIVFTTGNASIGSSRDHIFMDLSDNKYIDLSQPWWWEEATREVSLDGKKLRYLVGDIHIVNYTHAGALLFNTNKLSDGGYDPEALYKTVIERKWTYDKLNEMTASLYKDINGNGTVDDADLYGLLVIHRELIAQMEHTGAVRRYSRDENGHPYLDYDQERTIKMIDTLNKLLYETKGNAYIAADVDYRPFTTGHAVFFAGRIAYTTEADLREMEDNFGIIPYPMLDEEQGEYTNIIHNSSDFVAVPVTCKNPDEAGAILEALCAESYRTVIEPFYETALKTKYSRDSYSGQCIDIIRAVSTKALLFEYNNITKGGVMIGDQVAKGTNNFASAYASQKPVTDQKIKDLIAKYAAADAKG